VTIAERIVEERTFSKKLQKKAKQFFLHPVLFFRYVLKVFEKAREE